MTTVMTPSKPITDGQIGKLQELLGARLRKSGIPSEPVQQVLETQGDAIAGEMLAVIRRHVEVVSTLIVRHHVKVDRTRTPQTMLDATGRKQYTDRKVVDAMPRGEGVETDVYFFRPRPEAYKDGLISDDRLEEEFEFYGLKPDPYAQAAVNEADLAFADKHPNGTHWKNADGKWCFAAFSRWFVKRSVLVNRDVIDWGGHWWFAGVRK